MRKITKEATKAFFEKKNYSKDNTTVKVEGDVTLMYLHGNLIGELNHATGRLRVTNAGWYSVTTKERLNGILREVGFSLYQHQREWFIKLSSGQALPFTGRFKIFLEGGSYHV